MPCIIRYASYAGNKNVVSPAVLYVSKEAYSEFGTFSVSRPQF